jgi:NAD(P)H-nitrite reductase large subunit
LETDFDLVVIGGSAGGTHAAAAALEYAPDSRVALISDEDRIPYKRTKISKSFAKGFDPDEFAIYDAPWYAQQEVTLYTKTGARAIDRDRKRVVLSSGEELPYRSVVLATGARPRLPELPGTLSDHVFTAHRAAQIERLQQAARRSDAAVVIGMGILGAEVAEQLCRMGLTVHLVGNRSRMIPRTFDTELSELIEGVFRENGVKLYFDEPEHEIEGEPYDFTVHLRRAGVDLSAQLLVYAIGLDPVVDVARSAGLSVDTGVKVVWSLRTSDPAIYAAGDMAQLPDGSVTHLWRHAMEQGARAGENAIRAIRGEEQEPYRFVPFREKCKVFGHYFFSLCVPDDRQMSAYELHRYERGDRLVRAYVSGGAVHGLSMVNDMDREKLCMAAVREQWPLESLVSTLEL